MPDETKEPKAPASEGAPPDHSSDTGEGGAALPPEGTSEQSADEGAGPVNPNAEKESPPVDPYGYEPYLPGEADPYHGEPYESAAVSNSVVSNYGSAHPGQSLASYQPPPPAEVPAPLVKKQPASAPAASTR